MKKIVSTVKAPSPIGPYSQAVIAGNFLFVSGQIAMDPASGTLIRESISAETAKVMENLEAILKEAGVGFPEVVKATIFLKNMDDFPVVNEVYAKHFPTAPPARETVQVSRLPKDVNVEISVIAVVK